MCARGSAGGRPRSGTGSNHEAATIVRHDRSAVIVGQRMIGMFGSHRRPHMAHPQVSTHSARSGVVAWHTRIDTRIFRASLAVSPLAESGGHSLISAAPFYLRHHPPRSDPSELSRHPQFRVRCGAGLRAPVVAPLASHLCPAVNCVRRTWAGPSTCFAFGAAVRTSLSSPRQSLSNMQENSRLEKRHPLASRPASRPGYVLTCARRSAPQV
jgi:hypothetical protein